MPEQEKSNHVLVWVAGVASVIVAAVIIGWGSWVTEKAGMVEGIKNYGIETRRWNHKIQDEVNEIDDDVRENNALLRENKKQIELLHK